MHLPFAHRNSSFSHVGTAGTVSVDVEQRTHTKTNTGQQSPLLSLFNKKEGDFTVI